MTDYFLALLAGAIQGLTEFLPVSSSAHLLILHDLLGFNLPDNLAFDAILHLGTAAALLLFFAPDLMKMLKSDRRLAGLIILATIPALLVGYFLNDLIETSLRSLWLVAAALIIVSILFLVLEKIAKKQNDLRALGWPGALLIGLAQTLALIPGVSRSGITIIAGLGLNLKRDQAARFAFLLSLPIVLAAGGKKLLEAQAWPATDLPLLALGFAAAFLTGYLVIGFLLQYLRNHSLKVFAFYRLALGGLLLAALLAGLGR